MLELLEKILLAGAGLTSMTKERAGKIVDSLIEKGQLKTQDKNAMISRLLKGTQQIDRELEKKIKDIALDVVKGSQKQIDILNKKLAKLAQELEAEKKNKKKKKS